MTPNGIRPVDAPAFAYRGGKGRLRRSLIRFMPLRGSTYIEPFAGRANVFFLMRTLGSFERYVLVDKRTYIWLNAVRSYDGRTLPQLSQKHVRDNPDDPDVLLMEPLVRWAGGGPDTAPIDCRFEDVATYQAVLARAAKLMESIDVYITNDDALDALSWVAEDAGAFAYLDPPYLGATVGSYDESDFDPQRLAHLLKSVKCRWALSEYANCAFWLGALGRPSCVVKNVAVTPGSGRVRREQEALWTSYPATPGIIDFQDAKSGRPGKHVVNMLAEVGSMTETQYRAAAPVHWGPHTLEAQWKRLCALPNVWFDGETAFQLDPPFG